MPRAIFFALLFTILAATAVYADTYAIVTGSRVNVREFAEICDNVLFRVERGTVIEIRGVAGDFFRAEISGTDAYIAREFVRVTHTTGVITAPLALVYDIREESTTPFSNLDSGDIVTVVSTHENYFGIEFNGQTAFIEQHTVEIPYFAELPVARIGSRLADIIIETAQNYIGTPYRWGGTTSAGFDCSGFMVYLFSAHGIDLNRSSRDQARNGEAVARHELERGDLVFFGSGSHINHVGLYIGGGNFIHSSSHRTGGVIICSMYDDHNVRGFITARRVI